MRVITTLRTLTVLAAISLLPGCSSGGSSLNTPEQAAFSGSAGFLTDPLVGTLNRSAQDIAGSRRAQHFASFYNCPRRGSIEYVSDFYNNVVDIYAGKLAGQTPCGRISAFMEGPEGLYVDHATHDLYVADTYFGRIRVYHRARVSPYNTYYDRSDGEYPVDVTVAKDGTLIASNLRSISSGVEGSISTWIQGFNGGRFVGNYPMTNSLYGGYVTAARNGTVYYNDVDATSNTGVVWSMSCPAGVCGPQTQVSGVSVGYPGGMAVDASGNVLINDWANNTADTFVLPNPNPSTLSVTRGPLGLAFDELDHLLFVAGTRKNETVEYVYPSGAVVGKVSGDAFGSTTGVAVDP